jgi:DNA-binding NarL/FixJ family response regulator
VVGKVVEVLLADDEAAIRALLREMLETDTRFRVVAMVGSADAAGEAASKLRPHLAVVDVRMPGGGQAAVAKIRSVSPETVVVACSSHDDIGTRASMTEAGARAYVLKGVDDILDVALDVLGLEATA